jgi:chorismate synthase
MLAKLRFLTAGESHGPALTVILEGIPAGLSLKPEDVNRDLQRRQQGYGRGLRSRKIESDSVRFLSGVRHGRTIGSPIAMLIENRDFENWRLAMSPEPLDELVPEEKLRPFFVPRPVMLIWLERSNS